MPQDPGIGSHVYTWDAGGRLVSVDGVAGQACQSTWIGIGRAGGRSPYPNARAVPPVTAFGLLLRYSFSKEALEKLDRMHDHPLNGGLVTQAGDWSRSAGAVGGLV